MVILSQQKDLNLSAHTVPCALPLSPLDEKSFLAIVEEVSDNPYRYKNMCHTAVTPKLERLRQYESDLMVILARELIYS